MDSSKLLSYINIFLDASHATTLPKRTSAITDALCALSQLLGISEILCMIPPTTKSLVICCPSSLRYVPWHLLYVELPSKKNLHEDLDQEPVKAIHLLENFAVRLGIDSLTYSLTYSLTGLLPHPLAYSLPYSLAYLLTYSLPALLTYSLFLRYYYWLLNHL